MELDMETNNEFERYQRAKKQVEEIKGFYGHLISFIFVIALFLYINIPYSTQYLWFFWSFLGWGIGLAFHGMKVFNYTPLLGKNWEERKLKEFMEQENRKNKLE
ncbi:MAG: 2TM domain-containing protein [Flavobacterium sp.]|nr:2TM domain-containing protein [Flavobacterium sp.]